MQICSNTCYLVFISYVYESDGKHRFDMWLELGNGLLKKNPNWSEGCCSYSPTVVAHNENESTFIIVDGSWNSSRDVCCSQSSANQCINIKNHKQEPEGIAQLLYIIVSSWEKNDPLGDLKFVDDVIWT